MQQVLPDELRHQSSGVLIQLHRAFIESRGVLGLEVPTLPARVTNREGTEQERDQGR